MKRNDILNDDDARLRAAFKSGLPEAPVTAWFTRKVMNRLPPQRRRVLSHVEWATYGIAVVILFCYWVEWGARILDKGTVTVADFGEMMMLMAFSLVPVLAIMIPKIAAWLRE